MRCSGATGVSADRNLRFPFPKTDVCVLPVRWHAMYKKALEMIDRNSRAKAYPRKGGYSPQKGLV